jgi:hypothetical protein
MIVSGQRDMQCGQTWYWVFIIEYFKGGSFFQQVVQVSEVIFLTTFNGWTWSSLLARKTGVTGLGVGIPSPEVFQRECVAAGFPGLV